MMPSSISWPPVQRFQIEVELAQVFGREADGFEFDGHQTVEATVEEQQVEREILLAHLQRVFAADKTEVAPEFEQELAQLHQQAALQVAFKVGSGQVEKLDQVAVFEHAGRVGVGLCHQW